MSLPSGSREYYDAKEQAERLYREHADAYDYDARKAAEAHMDNLADRLHEQHGYNDSSVEHIVNTYLRH